MANLPHVTAWAGRTKYQADGFLFDWMYQSLNESVKLHMTYYKTTNITNAFLRLVANDGHEHSTRVRAVSLCHNIHGSETYPNTLLGSLFLGKVTGT